MGRLALCRSVVVNVGVDVDECPSACIPSSLSVSLSQRMQTAQHARRRAWPNRKGLRQLLVRPKEESRISCPVRWLVPDELCLGFW